MPVHLTSFVGRERELEEVGRLVHEERLVSLVGAGGCGKTRLATEVADARTAELRDGAWFVDLASIVDGSLVPSAIASAAGLATPSAPHADQLAELLRGREALLVLDNCEHLVEDVAAVVPRLLRSPSLSVLATSREALGVEGERVYRVGPLAQEAAIRLFSDRARLADARFDLSGANLEAIDAICRRLDGLPLALELAAACAGSITLERLRDRLDSRFGLLTGSRSTLPRHRTLRAAVEWSEALLTEPDRCLFRRLAVFVGGFDVEAAEAVAWDEALPQPAVLPLLKRLVDRSLVSFVPEGEVERYRLLEPIREMASERLVTAGEAERVRTAHAAYFTSIAEPLFETWRRNLQPDAARLTGNIANFRAALEHSALAHPAQLAVPAGLLTPLWTSRLSAAEGRRWLELALPAAAPGSVERYRLLIGLASIGMHQGDPNAGDQALEALANREDADDMPEVCHSLALLSSVEGMAGKPAAVRYAERMLALARSLGDPNLLLGGLNLVAMGLMASAPDDQVDDRAVAAAEEAVQIGRREGEPGLTAMALDTLATAYLRRGDVRRALRAERECMVTAPSLFLGPPGEVATMAALFIADGQAERGVASLAPWKRPAPGSGSTQSGSGRSTGGGCKRASPGWGLGRPACGSPAGG